MLLHKWLYFSVTDCPYYLWKLQICHLGYNVCVAHSHRGENNAGYCRLVHTFNRFQEQVCFVLLTTLHFLPTLGHRHSSSPDSHVLSFSFSFVTYSYHSCNALPLCNSIRCSSCFVMSLLLAAQLRLLDLTIRNSSSTITWPKLRNHQHMSNQRI